MSLSLPVTSVGVKMEALCDNRKILADDLCLESGTEAFAPECHTARPVVAYTGILYRSQLISYIHANKYSSVVQL